MNLLSFLALFASFSCCFTRDCKLTILTHLGSPQPLILTENGRDYHLPNNRGEFNIVSGAKITVACFGSNVLIKSRAVGLNKIVAMCRHDDIFSVNRADVKFEDVKCQRLIRHTLDLKGIVRGLKKYEVSFDASLKPHLVHYFDDHTKMTKFTVYVLSKNIKGQQNCGHLSYFTEDGIFNLPNRLNVLYTKEQERKTINKLVSLNQDDTRYVSNAVYLAKGHFAAHCDFVFEAQQKSTYHYINVGPQWQSFNNGNWKTLEIDLRNYVNSRRVDLLIIVGVYQTSTLPDADTGVATELFLSVCNNNRAVPVPKYFWKLAYDQNSGKGAVFIGSNEYYHQSRPNNICADVSGSMQWLRWKKNEGKKGYSYACTIDDFKNVVQFLPVQVAGTSLLD